MTILERIDLECAPFGAGVDKKDIEISVEDGILNVEGRLDFSKYEGIQPLYTEYNIGHFRRSFSLPSKLDQSKISAEMKDGVLTSGSAERRGGQAAQDSGELIYWPRGAGPPSIVPSPRPRDLRSKRRRCGLPPA